MNYRTILLLGMILLNGFEVACGASSISILEEEWVAAQLDRLSTREKIAQMIMVAINSGFQPPAPGTEAMVGDEEAKKIALLERKAEVERLISFYHIGGLICFRGDPRSQVDLLTELQELSLQKSGLPLLVGQDAEWGLAMRLLDVPRLPKNMTLGAIQNKKLLKVFGKFVGFMCRTVGVHINFAPVIDVNTNPNNPVIGVRAFHEDPAEVGENAAAIVEGMLEENILPCAKHLPGHGDTSKDSHSELPVILHSHERLHSVELHPFKKLAKKFGSRIGFMVAHVVVPALTQDAERPASLSDKLVKGVVRKEIGFDGLVITDALNMRAITKFYTPGQAAWEAFKAGNDILLYAEDVDAALDFIEKKVREYEIYARQLDESVKRILRVKYKILEQNRVIPLEVSRDFFVKEPRILELKKRLYEEAITLIRDERGILPLRPNATRIGYIKIGGNQDSLEAVREVEKNMKTAYIGLDASTSKMDEILKSMEDCAVIIAAVGRVHEQQSPYGNIPEISAKLQTFMGKIHRQAKPVVLSLLVSPYALKFFLGEATCIQAYEDDPDAEVGALKVIFGQKIARGKLPIALVPVDISAFIQ